MALKESEEQPRATIHPVFLEKHKCKNQTKTKQNRRSHGSSILHTPDLNLKGMCFPLGRPPWACLNIFPAAIVHADYSWQPTRHSLHQPENLQNKNAVLKKKIPFTFAFPSKIPEKKTQSRLFLTIYVTSWLKVTRPCCTLTGLVLRSDRYKPARTTLLPHIFKLMLNPWFDSPLISLSNSECSCLSSSL